MRRRNYVRVDTDARATRRRRLVLAVAAVAACYFLATSIFGEMGVVKYYRMKARATSLAVEIDGLTTENDRLTMEVRALRSDPAYLERLARDKLGLARQGEIVYYYDETNPKSEIRNPE
jgi:cell division protein FtsB